MTLPLPCLTDDFLGDQAELQPHLISFISEDRMPERPEVPFQVGQPELVGAKMAARVTGQLQFQVSAE